VSNLSFDSACVVDSVMQDEVQTNQRQPEILFCHSCALRYTKFVHSARNLGFLN